MSHTLYSWHGNPRGNQVRIAADLAGVEYQFVNVNLSETKSESFLQKHPLGRVPLLEGPEGQIFETNAIMQYFARKAPKHLNLLGKGHFEQAQVAQWLSLNTELVKYEILGAIFVDEEISKTPEFQLARKEIMQRIQHINDHLVLNTYLVGNQLTIADVQLATILNMYFQSFLDEGYRKGHVALVRYYRTIIGQPALSKYYRPVFVKKDIFGAAKSEQQPKKQKKQEAPKPKAEKKEEEAKPASNKNPLELLPPTNFNLFDFKTFIVNEKDRQKGVDEFFKQCDFEGFSIWHLHYDKYTGEGIKLFLTSNLKDSFLQRCDQFRKWAFGAFGVYGEEGNYEIEGVWVWRGQEIPQEIKDVPMYEYYQFKKLDPQNEEHRKLLRESWTGLEEDKSVFNGMVARDVGYYK